MNSTKKFCRTNKFRFILLLICSHLLFSQTIGANITFYPGRNPDAMRIAGDASHNVRSAAFEHGGRPFHLVVGRHNFVDRVFRWTAAIGCGGG